MDGKRPPLFHILSLRTDIYMTDNAELLFWHFFRLMMVSHLARGVAIEYRKREIEASDAVGTGRRILWDVLLKGCEEVQDRMLQRPGGHSGNFGEDHRGR